MSGDHDVTIRFAYQDDAGRLAQLQALAGRPLPAGVLLIAEMRGSIRAAVDVGGVGVLADPSLASNELVSLLRYRTYQLHGPITLPSRRPVPVSGRRARPQLP